MDNSEFSIDPDFIFNDGSLPGIDKLLYVTESKIVDDNQWMDYIRATLGCSPLTTGHHGAGHKKAKNNTTDRFKITKLKRDGVNGFLAQFESGKEIWNSDFDNLQKILGIKSEEE